MLSQVISKISKEFINEAINSPNLLEDMASMEKYMSESYCGRIFVELLQNADDCSSKMILLTEKNGHIFFANDGRAFDESDVVAISRSGASTKKRGTKIGYRGIGFKSTTYLTSEIIVYSDETYFTFSKSICSKVLKKGENKIPTVRIPFLIKDIDKEIDFYVRDLKQKGYSTVFIFKNAKIDEFNEEIKEIRDGYFLFINNINRCIIDIGNNQREFIIKREKEKSYQLVTIKGKLTESWLTIKHKEISLAFKYEKGVVIPCNTEDAVYHCYLPTFDKVAFPIKVNGDFSTDPSRKHLTLDEITETAILSVSNLLFDILKSIFSIEYNSVLSNIFIILLMANSYSRANSFLNEHLNKRIISEKWILQNNNVCITAQEYKTLPDWLEESEKTIVRHKSKYVKDYSLHLDVYSKVLQVEKFLSQYSTSKYTIEELITIMEDVYFVTSINSRTAGKILANIIKDSKAAQFIGKEYFNYNKIAISTDVGVTTIERIAKTKGIKLSNELKEAINQVVSLDEIRWFCKKTSIDNSVFVDESKSHLKIVDNTLIEGQLIWPSVSKWRSAEQQCVELEKHFGNNAIDVSKQNIGYDVESTTPTGSKRYIEVKSLSSHGSSFSITNNEYTAAHQYGNEYYLCLIIQGDNETNIIYICNPLESLKFEKRIRQWEWYCEQYNGVEVKVYIK